MIAQTLTAPYPAPMSLGSQLQRYRDALGVTYADLSLASGVDIGTLHALVKRNSTRSQYVGQIAAALGLSVEQLLDESRMHEAALSTISYAAPAPAARPCETCEPKPLYSVGTWPFKTITPEQWESLSAAVRAEVEGYVRGLLSASLRQASAEL